MEIVRTHFRPGIPGLVPDAWIVAPRKGCDHPPVVAVHGVTRKVEEMVETLIPRARATGRTLVIPHFSLNHFKRYQLAFCKQRADLALLRLMKDLRAVRLIGDGPFDLSGFSGGGQFAHRFTWLYPQAVENLCVTAPGWWTFPDPQVSWPYGIGREPGSPDKDAQSFRLTAHLPRFLDRHITVCVGVEDIEYDANLRRGAAIDAQQGRNRVERARIWFAAAKSAAIAQNIVPRMSFRLMPECGHSFADCVARGDLDEVFVTHAKPKSNSPHTSHNQELPTIDFMKRTAA